MLIHLICLWLDRNGRYAWNRAGCWRAGLAVSRMTNLSDLQSELLNHPHIVITWRVCVVAACCCRLHSWQWTYLFQSLGFRLPTDIQAESIPLILGGGDVLMVGPPLCMFVSDTKFVYCKFFILFSLFQAAETGSGKTGVSTWQSSCFEMQLYLCLFFF